MQSLFEKNVIRMKQELRDLKTAQKRGLGTVRFYRKTIRVEFKKNVGKTWRVTLATGGFYPAILTVIAGPLYSLNAPTTEGTRQYNYSLTLGEDRTLTITATSSTPIESMEVTS